MDCDQKVFAFDVGKASLGLCAREGNHILALESLLIPAEFAATSDFRSRRRAYRTRLAHKKREEWLCQAWRQCDLAPLKQDDDRLKWEFPRKNDDTIYNSALLRIALLQERPLQDWQIFKALWAAIQRRGYDKDCDWNLRDGEEALDEDSKENLESVGKYQDALYYHTNSLEPYLFPCYLEASLMGLWHWEQPDKLKIRIDGSAGKVRQKGMVAPRALVEKEIRCLLANAQKQLPALQKLSVGELLYGPAQKPYASLSPEFAKFRGSEWDAQGVLSQKVPRFDNRILNKCQMLPKRNVCKASDPLSLQFTLLMKLKNIRFTDENGEVGQCLSPDELKKVYELCQENLMGKKTQEVTLGNLIKFIEKTLLTKLMDINMTKGEKIKLNASGRARFCRPALTIMNRILLEGIDPPAFDVSPYVQSGKNNGITFEELETMIARLGETWEGFHVGDKRYVDLETTLQTGGKERAILKLIGSVNNPVVRHRLTFFWNQLKKLTQAHGEPDKVILEFVRGGEGLDGKKTANDWEKEIKNNETRNDRIRQQLEEQGLKAHKWNIDRFKLAEEQQWTCPYTGERLHAGMLEQYQLDHIVPVSSKIATDAFYNKVLCISTANQDKGDQTPFQWLSGTDQWPDFLARITDKNSQYSKKKKELLIREDARELVSSYNGLAETAYIARLAQQIVALQFAWGLQTRDDNRRVFVNDGKMTAKIRKIYKLNELLLTDDEKTKLSEARDAGLQRTVWKKNRENPKHHALDAYCISYSQELRIKNDKPDEEGYIHWYVPALEKSLPQFKGMLDLIFPKRAKRDKDKLKVKDMFYGIRTQNGKNYLVRQIALSDYREIKQAKELDNIFDQHVRKDLKEIFATIKEKEEWVKILDNYRHPKRKSIVRNVLKTFKEDVKLKPSHTKCPEKQAYKNIMDFGKAGVQGQYKEIEGSTGQLICLMNGKVTLRQIYAHQSARKIYREAISEGYQMYLPGEKYIFAGCEIRLLQDIPEKSLPAGLYAIGKTSGNNIYLEDGNHIGNTQGRKQLTIQRLVEAGFELVE